MLRLLARAALLLVVLPLAAGGGAAYAAEEVTVPGCYGGGSGQTTFCDPTVRVATPYEIETYQTWVPVCVTSCTYVPVTLPWFAPGEETDVCVSWVDGNGNEGGTC